MKIYATIKTAIRALSRNMMRVALTALGIIIGVGAVITMMEIGSGSSTAIRKGIADMGANVLLIIPGNATTGGVNRGVGTALTLTPEDADAVLRECPSVKNAAPVVRARTQLIYGNRNWVPAAMAGTTPAFLEIFNWSELADGDPFTDQDVRSANKVCLLGQTIVRELFQGKSPVGLDVRVNNVSFRVIGTLKAKGANLMGMDQDDILIAPWTTIKYRVTGATLETANQSQSSGAKASTLTLSGLYPGGKIGLYPERSEIQQLNNPMQIRITRIDQILAVAHSELEITGTMNEIKELLRERHGIASGKNDDFEIRDMTELTKTLSSTTNLMTNLLLCVALISLVVGGVGIMNIMFVSVTERTREIGVRMAVGAQSSDILQQFLVEAVMLCILGGAMGILLGLGSSYVVHQILNWPIEASPESILAAVVVATSVGIIFGFYPAWKAARLNPIEALRYE